MNVEQAVAHFRRQLEQLADAERARGQKAYLKSSLKFYGVTVPQTRQLVKAWLKAQPRATMGEIARLAEALWDSEWHEQKLLAIELLQARSAELTRSQLPLLEKTMHEATTWAHLDGIAVWLVGALIDNDPDTLDNLPRWAQSDNFWVRRAALLAQILQFRRGAGDLDLFTKLVVPMLDEGKNWSKDERFFIRKAIGWALRELAAHRPEWVYHFVRQHREQMAGLTFREATRKLPAAYRNRLTD